MKRKLLRQIANEWRINIWLAIELIIVSVALWYLCDQLWVRYSVYSEPLGYDTSHCYLLDVVQLNEKSPLYKPYSDSDEAIADRLKLTDRLKARPEIEAVGLGVNSYFYNGSNSFTYLSVDSIGSSYLRRVVTPDFLRVFRIHGANGETPKQLADLLEKTPENGFMASEDLLRYVSDPKKRKQSINGLVGSSFWDNSGNNMIEYKLVKTVTPLKYSDYNSIYNSPSLIMPLTNDWIAYANETVVRVKDNMDKNFIENMMKDAQNQLRVGNWYIASVQSFDDIRKKFNLYANQNNFNTIVWSLFLLLNIFLGVLGTFWFRTSQRTPEIALRMANGASRSDIFRRVLAEGEIILIAVTPISLAICYMITHYELNAFYMGNYFDPLRFFGCALITFALISLMIVVGSWMPARKAMSISPALALKTE